MAKRIGKLNRASEVPAVSWQDALSGYLMWKKAEGKSERTIRDYRYHVTWFFERTGASLSSESELRKAILVYMGEPAKPAYYNLKLASLKGFFRWCIDEGYMLSSPLDGLKRKKAEPRTVRVEQQTLKAILALPDQRTFVGARDYALLLLQLDTGIRPKEALSLLPSDVNIKSLEVRVRAESAKTRQERTVMISPITAKAIHKLLCARLDEWGDSVPVFCSYEGNRLLSNHWLKRLSGMGKKLGEDICPYDLRHTFAVEFLRNGGNSFALQRTMGHADIRMTQRYVAFTDEDLRTQHDKCSPVLQLLRKTTRLVKLK